MRQVIISSVIALALGDWLFGWDISFSRGVFLILAAVVTGATVAWLIHRIKTLW